MDAAGRLGEDVLGGDDRFGSGMRPLGGKSQDGLRGISSREQQQQVMAPDHQHVRGCCRGR